MDIETYSSENLAGCGVYKYAESKDFEILLFAFAYNDDLPQVIDLTKGEKIPQRVLNDLTNPNVKKVAHNAAFERVCLSKYLGLESYLPPEQWDCTAIRALEAGYPSSLNGAGLALGLPDDKAKDKAGKALIRYFCGPCKPTKANGKRTRNLPEHDPEKWAQFIEYNRQDVVAEQEIYRRLNAISPSERELYFLDQRINDNGIPIDPELVRIVSAYSPQYKDDLIEECQTLTGGIKPTQVQKLKAWLIERLECEPEELSKLSAAKLEELLSRNDLPDDVRRVLEIRQEAGKSSVSKYEAFERCACMDQRIRGAFQFYGASHTGRWAGRLIQPQNFPRNDFNDVSLAREIISNGDFTGADMLFPSLTGVFKTLVRTLVKAPEGKVLAIADYSAIEARVIAWLAGEQWRIDAFENGEDIYCASASRMFGVPVEKHGRNADLRKKGKVAELALGYAGGVGALKAFGADKMGLSDTELKSIVSKWREASPKIVSFWYAIENAAIECVDTENPQRLSRAGVQFEKEGTTLFMKLPSGRRLAYPKARLKENDFGRLSVVYGEMNTANQQWREIFTRGGTLVENLCQAVARDCLAEAMKRIEKEYRIVLHVHDEVVVEVPAKNAQKHLDRICQLMSNGIYKDFSIPWAKGLILTAEGFISPYYRKD